MFDGVTTYLYRTPAAEVCESEMMVMRYFLVETFVDCSFHGETILQQK